MEQKKKSYRLEKFPLDDFNKAALQSVRASLPKVRSDFIDALNYAVQGTEKVNQEAKDFVNEMAKDLSNTFEKSAK